MLASCLPRQRTLYQAPCSGAPGGVSWTAPVDASDRDGFTLPSSASRRWRESPPRRTRQLRVRRFASGSRRSSTWMRPGRSAHASPGAAGSSTFSRASSAARGASISSPGTSRDRRVPQEWRAHPGRQGRPGRRESAARRDLPEALGLRVQLVQRVRGVPPDPKVLQVRRVREARRVITDQKVLPVHRVHRVSWDQPGRPARRARRDRLAPKVRPVLRVRRGRLDPRAPRDHPGRPVRRVRATATASGMIATSRSSRSGAP